MIMPSPLGRRWKCPHAFPSSGAHYSIAPWKHGGVFLPDINQDLGTDEEYPLWTGGSARLSTIWRYHPSFGRTATCLF